MTLLIRGARLYGEGEPVDVLVDNGVISEISPAIGSGSEDVEVVDAGGQVLLPGFVDLHTHLREPGREDAETVESGSAAAALGGYTAVFAMANTDPVADNAVVVEHVWRRGRETGLVDVHPVGAVTAGLKGEKLAELGTMAKSAAGVRVFSDDGHCVADPLLMRRALEYSTALDVVIAQHAEEPRLTIGAQAHEGENASRLGYAGWPASAEESIVARDCLLAQHAGARLHICHVSTAGTVDVLRWAKDRGTRVSAEVTPHHLLLTDERLATYDPVNKVNPPLRTAGDAARLRAALAEGVLDCVATDHAPHAVQDKDCEWAAARPGMLGLQTALSVVTETMVRTGLLDWRGVARVMSERPAEIAGLADQGRPLEVGEPANLTLVDPDAEWTVRGAELASIAANTPYEGMRLPGVVTLTLLRGQITAREGKIV
ncbi:dihydroorotase [Amycolatopsis bartoniae]|uniref:Dihydroorotase n=1 Tax=Amycolatopsis bartoniae TaxID=941986 RepID=A0A8H9M875_9PSEU|nr:dihydroorotase [Amycolatopsis bartoniae]MBB2939162.1 dihydroorotase [Amycolatopsis bartoniae]TVT09635.1 dihydroorotase [Amycolatopsis bartoniae]GHF38553.1 dihydroorotase [Amycolatopsis bartoniae]